MKKGNEIVSRENAVCPSCGSLERTRLLYLYLKNETTIFENQPNILHFAPEEILKLKLVDNPNYVDVDLNPNLARTTMDITDIKFPDHQFDFIICSHVLGHVPDEKKALSEMLRVLKPRGKLFLLSLMNLENEKTLENPNLKTPSEKLLNYGESDLERLYGKDFIERIDTPSHVVEKIDYRLEFDEKLRIKMSLGDGSREIIYVVKHELSQ